MTSEPPGAVSAADTAAPLVLVRGGATDEEVAALLAVLSTASAPASAETPPPASRWAAPARQVRVTLRHGPGGWAASALPR